MKRVLIFLAILVPASLAWLIVYLYQGQVLQQKLPPTGQRLILVREIQLQPWNLGWLLGVNDCIHRCEYVPYPGRPATESTSSADESYYPTTISIEWVTPRTAKVHLDNEAAFVFSNGGWAVGDLPP